MRLLQPRVLHTHHGSVDNLRHYPDWNLVKQQMKMRNEKKRMWAVGHVPSGFWDQGDTTLVLYPFEYDAKLACANDSFIPVPVLVTLRKADE